MYVWLFDGRNFYKVYGFDVLCCKCCERMWSFPIKCTNHKENNRWSVRYTLKSTNRPNSKLFLIIWYKMENIVGLPKLISYTVLSHGLILNGFVNVQILSNQTTPDKYLQIFSTYITPVGHVRSSCYHVRIMQPIVLRCGRGVRAFDNNWPVCNFTRFGLAMTVRRLPIQRHRGTYEPYGWASGAAESSRRCSFLYGLQRCPLTSSSSPYFRRGRVHQSLLLYHIK